MRPLIGQSQSGLSLGEVRRILKLFKFLQEATRPKSIRKNRELEKKACKEAEEEFVAELKKREQGLTFGPGRNIVPKRIKKSEDKKLRQSFDYNVKVRAEKKYRSLDVKYDAKIRTREEKIQLLIQKIDHTITPMSLEFKRCLEANKTLLIADWPELRKVMSWRDFTTQEMLEQIDRTIIALKILVRRLRREKIKSLSLIGAAKWVCREIIRAFWDSFLEWCSKGSNNK